VEYYHIAEALGKSVALRFCESKPTKQPKKKHGKSEAKLKPSTEIAVLNRIYEILAKKWIELEPKHKRYTSRYFA
jgi:hypothetical protein